MAITESRWVNPLQKRTKRKAITAAVAALIALALLALAIGAGYYVWTDAYDQSASRLQVVDGSQEDIVSLLNERAEQSRLWISAAGIMRVDSATGSCTAGTVEAPVSVLDNLEENNKDIAYTITLEDGTVIYESGLIEPGQSIESPVLTTIPNPGTYQVTATAQGYDRETHAPTGGTVAAQITMTVV